jgi:hypothetical protein
MAMTLGRTPHSWRKARERSSRIGPVVAFLASLGAAVAGEPAKDTHDRFPTVPAGHMHVRWLLDDGMKFLSPDLKMVDPTSGYPLEGWNHDPSKGLFLRAFTQLTAIGKSMEMLADVVAGNADSPALSREQALVQLTRLVATLRRDQRDPTLASKGLLVNFLDLSTDKRLAPLASDVYKDRVLAEFGAAKGESLWDALIAHGWIVPQSNGREAEIKRGINYGFDHFEGALKPHGDEATKKKILAILDQRVVLIVFGDNANLSTSVAKTIGALLLPQVADRSEVIRIRAELEAFLDDQKDGYAKLYDAKTGLIYFGYNETKKLHFGWEDSKGLWTLAHMDYFVNEFRDPAIFVAARFGLPSAAIRNLGFKMKPYRLQNGKVTHVLAPWDGSAFQAMGLGLSLTELDVPSWRELLGNVVDVEVDYSTSHKLPGFLSEAYTGVDTQYSGSIGIPAITVNPMPRLTDAPSLYTIGVAYTIAPGKVEAFLAANWPVVSGLLTDHGPWEGFNVTQHEAVRFQTTAHTLSMILGLLRTGPEHMSRYVAHRGLTKSLAAYFPRGESTDLLAGKTQIYAWGNKEATVRSSRESATFQVRGDHVERLGIAFVSDRTEGVNLSGGHLVLRYRSSKAIEPVLITLKPPGGESAAPGLISKEITILIEDTGGREAEIRIPLPSSIGLTNVKEVVLTHERLGDASQVDLSITRFEFVPSPEASFRGK